AEMPATGKAASPPAPADENAPAGDRWTVVAEPSRGDYARQVELALSAIAGTEGLEKVVLARRLALHSTTPIDVQAVLARLRTDRSVTTFCVPLPPATDSGSPNEAARGAGGGVLVGATPELLVERSGRQVISHPLAGSARRNQEEPDEDDAAGRRLLQSAKDLREHALVVEMVADLLAPYCRTLNVPDVPSLASTRTMWHLGTQVRGELRSNDVSSAELAVLLHPTPAVCGMSKPLAYELIHKLEPFDRGFYAGAVGWCDDRGDGRWMVALRCAELYEGDALLYAG